MYLVDLHRVEAYLGHDVVNDLLDRHSRSGDEALVCQQWLRQAPAKRYIMQALYGDLLDDAQRRRVLDVGGGLTALTRVLATRHQYRLADLLAHDDASAAAAMEQEAGTPFIYADDWATLGEARYDLVIANDLFPNVDQRLEQFLARFLPQTDRMRLSLTYYDAPRAYKVRRVDADEILHVLAWDGAHLSTVLRRHGAQVVQADFDLFARPPVSVFPNGRQVCLLELQGKRSSGVTP